MRLDISKDAVIQRVRAGRTVEEIVADIEKDEHLIPFSMIRERLIAEIGIAKKKKEKAPNVIIFGCLFPFEQQAPIHSYLELLDRFGLEYTYLDKEYCCGSPMIEMMEGADRDRAEEASRRFMEKNLSMAQAAGAKNMVYWCVWCAYMGKKFLGDSGVGQLYFPDLILDQMEQRQLRLPPKTIGYYDGCHTRAHALAPGFDLDWRAYRDILSRIEGLQVVDLPNKLCCITHSPQVIEAASKHNLQTIVCSCTAGHIRLGKAAAGRMEVRYWPEIILEAVRETTHI